MISASTFFTDTFNTVDAVIGNFVNLAYVNFIQANLEMITLLLTVYIMFLGYRFLNHGHHFGMHQIMRHLIVMLVVYGLVMRWDLYNTFIYNIFTNEPGNIAKIMIDSAGSTTGGTSITQALDSIYQSIIDAAMGFFGQINFSASGIAFFFYGILIFLIGMTMCIFALLLFIYAKMMMAIIVALGPLFILFYLFDTTKNLFGAWLQQLITIALIPIITSAILVLMLSVIHVTLPNLNQPIEHMQFYGIAPFLGLSLATAMILSQVLKICSSLGSGLTLDGLSKGASISNDSLKYSGISTASQKTKSALTARSKSRFHY